MSFEADRIKLLTLAHQVNIRTYHPQLWLYSSPASMN